jgi:hypothetical protein
LPVVGTGFNWGPYLEGLRYCGVGIGYDDIYVQGNPAELKFIAYYIRGGQVTAVAR